MISFSWDFVHNIIYIFTWNWFIFSFSLTLSVGKANQKITTDHDILGDDDLLSLEFGDGDDSVGQLLLKIDILQAEVAKLKSRYESITRENAERISLSEKLQLSSPLSENGIEENYIPSQSTGVAVPQTGEASYVEVPVTSGCIDPASFDAYKTVTTLHSFVLHICVQFDYYLYNNFTPWNV